MSNQPLVSIGLPTYNRAEPLRRAVESVLSQDYQNIELIISDNASTDETEALGSEFARHDGRVRYLRQSTNQGPAFNFSAVLEQAQGEFFMWLGDDDWLDPGYISECAQVLARHPEYELVGARAKYFRDSGFAFAEQPINLEDDSGSERVVSYFRKVATNGLFYGVMRREVLSALGLQKVIASDWLLLAQVSYLGKVRTLETVSVNRTLGGASHDAESLIALHKLPSFLAWDPYLPVALKVFKDVAWNSQVYRSLGRVGRVSLAARSAFAILERYSFPVWRKTISVGASREWKVLKAKLVLRTRLKRLLRMRH
jgi:glycosyltransferase involved in cell wall biosynthesis